MHPTIALTTTTAWPVGFRLRHSVEGSPSHTAESSSSPADRPFASSCFSPRLTTTQLPSATELWSPPTRTCTVLIWHPRGRTTGSHSDPLSPLKGAALYQVHLVDSTIFLILAADVLPNHRLITAYRGDEVSARPEVLPDEVALALHVRSRDVDRALTLYVPHHLRYRILRWDRDHHVYMIRHQMPFLDPALLLLGQSPEHLPKLQAQLPIQHLAMGLLMGYPFSSTSGKISQWMCQRQLR